MKARSRKTILTVSLTLLLVGMTLFFIRAVKKDSDLPVYEGKNVKEWFYGEDGDPSSTQTYKDAKVVFSEMGTNCVPFLIHRLKAENSILNRFYSKIYPRLPSNIRSKISHKWDPDYVKTYALSHLIDLPPQHLDPYALELMELFFNPPKIRHSSTEGCYYIAQRSALRSNDLKAKASFFQASLSYPDSRIQLESAILLSEVDSGITNGIPILVNALTNGTHIASLYPQRDRAFSRTDDSVVSQVQEQAHRALARIAPELAKQYPIEEPEP